MEQSQHVVKIVFVTGHAYPPVIGFKFADFAIILTYDMLRACGGFTVFYDSECKHYDGRLSYELRWFRRQVADFSFSLPFQTVEEIRRSFKNNETPFEKLIAVLENCMPRDILPKFFK